LYKYIKKRKKEKLNKN